jgi:hypothetical protein
MMFCQIRNAKSLREISGGLASCEGKLTHLGMKGAPSRSTLAYANEHRSWELYKTVFEQLRPGAKPKRVRTSEVPFPAPVEIG